MEEKRYRRIAAAALAFSALPIPTVVAGAVAVDFFQLGVDLFVTVGVPAGFLSCAAGILLGHFVLDRRPVPLKSTRETRWALSAIMIGYFCLIPTCCAFPLLAALIELPWVISRSVGKNLGAAISATIGLAAATNLCHAGGDILFLAALLGTVELALFAGWMPFARRPGLPGRDRMILSVLFYSLTIGTVVWGYYAWSRGN